jgi:hypothetical protein
LGSDGNDAGVSERRGGREKEEIMEYMIGLGLAGAFCLFAKAVGYECERSFYPAVTIAVATYYILFAAMAGSTRALAMESLVACGFLALAAAGFRVSPWLVVAGLTGHGAFDLVHHHLIENPGMPAWWPGFCSSFDILAGGYLAWLLLQGRLERGLERSGAVRVCAGSWGRGS